MRDRQWLTPWRLACATLVILSGAVFAGSLGGVAVWDDIPLINGTGTGDSLLHVFSRPFLGSYFRPLVSLSFYLERLLWGSGPFGYHQTNLMIHAANTALLITLFRVAFGDRRIAFVGAAIFAFHPVHVSAVAWIGGRTDPMLCLFLTCTALCLIRSAKAEPGFAGRPLFWSAFWYAMALLTKEQALAALPLAPLAYRFFGGRSWDMDRRRQARAATCLFAGIASVFFVCWFLAAPPKQSLLANGPLNHLLRAGHTLLAYCGLLLAPNGTWMHTFTISPAERYGWPAAVAGFAIFAALALFAWSAWRRASQAAWWSLWILLLLLPVSNLLPIATLLVAPYRTEVAQIPLAALAGWGLIAVWDRLARPGQRLALSVAGAAAGIWCVWLCIWGSGLWLSSETIFRQICRADPDCIFAREAVVQSLLSKGRLASAGRELEELLNRLMPDGSWRDAKAASSILRRDTRLAGRLQQSQGGSINPNVWLSNVYAQLGTLRIKQADSAEGERYLRTAVILEPRCFDALIGLGFLDLERGNYERAGLWADRAIARDPLVADAWTLRGQSDVGRKRWREAKAAFERCTKLQPWAGEAYIKLADARLHLGDRRGAVATLAKALKRSPRRDDIRRRMAALQSRASSLRREDIGI